MSDFQLAVGGLAGRLECLLARLFGRRLPELEEYVIHGARLYRWRGRYYILRGG